MDLENAISKHAEWKLKFRMAISKHETLDDKTMSVDNMCELGKWLHSEAGNKYSYLPAYSDCLKKHSEFHNEAGKVARLINAKKFKEAEEMISTNSSYSQVSLALGVAISTLKKEANL